MNDTTRGDAEADEPPSSVPAPAAPDITCDLDAPDVDPPADGWLAEQLAAAVRGAGLGGATLAIRVVNDAAMEALHRLHSGVSGTTDVLTFDNRDDPRSPIDGDLVLCRDEAVRRAAELGHDARLELLLYAVHGLLHLDGEDDHSPAGHRRMHEREDAILASLGHGPVFFKPEAAR
ncbi:rRNA maturation RNase YbeY [Phycisphaera mikurensis]|uniref:Endoribonuclease YbeY n=1 Tax=Phycisphaera mikurensis (strain NBRC 102666 / KCTC 22515 / FYK2301M01) TaxID=1142394 RepID=I0IEC0_PHYMF|nr:rRNA maturation RNase YbeY [Phycisphaera mikurensis]MBB6441408.1 putative rRNA maturation factor [Phycisphaera mikurensis]BAM03608.1 putative rRNA maturation factor [Phycisphaera mikurensis NBRC 102666]